MPADADVVAVVLAGDVDAYAVLVDRYRDAYVRFAVRMLVARGVRRPAHPPRDF